MIGSPDLDFDFFLRLWSMNYQKKSIRAIRIRILQFSCLRRRARPTGVCYARRKLLFIMSMSREEYRVEVPQLSVQKKPCDQEHVFFSTIPEVPKEKLNKRRPTERQYIIDVVFGIKDLIKETLPSPDPIFHEPEANERGEAGNVASSESQFLGVFIIYSHSILRLKALASIDEPENFD